MEKSRTLMALATTGTADCQNARATSFPTTIVGAQFIDMTTSEKLMRAIFNTGYNAVCGRR